jgi:hypothetical protein
MAIFRAVHLVSPLGFFSVLQILACLSGCYPPTLPIESANWGISADDGAQIGNLGVLLLEKRGQLFLNEAVESVEHVGGESVAALHDNLVAADRGRDLAFRGQHWLVIKVKVSVGHMRLL